ncbi:HEF3 [Symbiodinium natans]|uniref:HEF3 protein n=1 Tax=Symbiodinium natans TaxID=878477 RepID=A0A812UVS3_9DINO|nr:HEF3 [Symbiodinium natans]
MPGLASWFRGARRDSDSQPTAEKATKGAEDTAPRRSLSARPRQPRQPRQESAPPRQESTPKTPNDKKDLADESYDRNAVKLRTPVEVTMAKSGGKGGKQGKSLWMGADQSTKATSFFSAKGARPETGKGDLEGKGSQKGQNGGEHASLGKNRTDLWTGTEQSQGQADVRDARSVTGTLAPRRSRWRSLASVRLNEVVQGKVTCFVEDGAKVDFGCLVEALLPNSHIDFPAFPGDLLMSLVVDEIDAKEERVVVKFMDDTGWEENYCSDGYCETDVEDERPGERTNGSPPKVTPSMHSTREVFPEPDEVPRLTRSEMRGGPTAPRPNRFRRQLQSSDPDSGGDQDELVAELLPDILKVQENVRSETSRSSAEEEEESRPAELAEAEAPQGPPPECEDVLKEDSSRTALHSPPIKNLLRQLASGQPGAAEECGKVVAAADRPVQACAAVSAALRVLLREPSTALAALKGMVSLHEEVGRASEPFMVRNLPVLLDKFGSRQRDVQVAAEDAAETLIARLNPYGVETALPAVLGGLKQKEKTEVKVGALRLLALMRDEDTIKPLACQLDRVMPHIAEMLNDVKREVRQTVGGSVAGWGIRANCHIRTRGLDGYGYDNGGNMDSQYHAEAADAAKVLFECAQNKDLDPYLDEIIKATGRGWGVTADRSLVPTSPGSLVPASSRVTRNDVGTSDPDHVGTSDGDARTTKSLGAAHSEAMMDQEVETPALAIVMPLIVRGLKDRDERTKRRALVIADNMCKLVPDVTEIQPFLPSLIPLVEKATHNISDPEVRNVASRCYRTLQTAEKADRRRFISKTAVLNLLQEKIPEEKTQLVSELVADYVASLCTCISACRSFEYAEWWQCIAPYLSPSILSVEDCEDLVPDLLESCYDAAEGDDVEDLDEEGEDLCNCVFTLGYGALTLLNNTRLHLKRGKCYGLCGPNDCGKSTLLRAINNEQVDGFPPKSELVTAFVEHGIGEKEPECVVAALRSIGFDDQKLKLGLVRAMLMCADILLLDEPTGHLDVANVSWLGDYLLSLSRDSSRPVTTIVVSHDTSFLDKVCTHVINVKQRKLKTYKGNITDFVRRCPEAKSYLSLTNDKQRFILPEPGMLEGVKSKGKKLLKMHNVTYTYPGNQTPTLFNVSIEVSLLSRVAVIGPNGAGKSTMIKACPLVERLSTTGDALVGELPVTGKSIVWKHPNVRISYVAQHAFHHVEQHLDITPTQYLLWRFAGGEDREALNYRSEEVSGEKRKYWLNEAGVLCKCTNPKEEAKAVDPELILGRKKSKSKANSGDEKYEYSVKWHGFGSESIMWVPRDILLEMGHLRLIQREVDERQAAAHGLVSRPLTQPQVEEHLAGFGLDSNLASHTRLGILSGGQKVKVVLGAAMWLSPHILILDEREPEAKRAAASATDVQVVVAPGRLWLTLAGLKEFGGHRHFPQPRVFCHAVCDERWLMDAGRLTREGQLSKADVALEGKTLADEYTDEFGNVHKIKKQNHTEKELKKIKRQKELARKRGDVFIEDEDEWWEKLQEDVSKPEEPGPHRTP